MTSYVPPIKNGAGGWIGYVSLAPRTATGAWQSNPTLAAGDVKISIDGGSLANLTTLPAVTPASSKLVKITLSQAETNGDNLTIIFSDAAGAEWCDLTINLQTVARQIDDLAYPATSGRSITVDASGNANANLVNIAGSAVSTSTAQLGVNVVQAGATAWGSGAITAASIATGAITSAKFAAGAIDAAAIAADAIGASELAADAATEIATAVWANATRTVSAATNITSTGGSVPITAGGLVSADVTAISTDTIAADNAESFFDGTGYAGTNNVIPTVTTLTNLPAITAGWLTATGIAADAITAAKLAADVTTELQSGLATAASLSTVDTNVSAIKAKTDSLAFTVAGQVDANIQYVNDVQVTGTGASGDEWGP